MPTNANAIYITKEGEQLGPFSADDIILLIDNGHFSWDDLGWREGLEEWVSLQEIFEEMGAKGEAAPARRHLEEKDKQPPSSPADHALNPWVSIWTKPRATIQQIVDTDPKRLVIVLACLGGFAHFLDRASQKAMGDNLDWHIIFIIAALAGPVLGVISLYLFSALLQWTGGWIGGHATFRDLQADFAWSTVPKIWASYSGYPRLLYLVRKCSQPKSRQSLQAIPCCLD